jgi:hypothetical protein
MMLRGFEERAEGLGGRGGRGANGEGDETGLS